MMTVNRPVEMISVCSREGALQPARFRLEDEEGALCTVRIRQIQKEQEIKYVGTEALRYICTANWGGRERRFELRYTLRAHRWVLHAFLDGGDA